jgi:hypothetical protein
LRNQAATFDPLANLGKVMIVRHCKQLRIPTMSPADSEMMSPGVLR